MKNKILITASVFALTLGYALTSNAGCDGIYLAGRLGNAKQHSDSPLAGSASIKKDVFMWSGALGYRYGYVRTELEYVWRDTVDHKDAFSATDEWNSESYMWNAYWDLSPYTWFTPYFSAGLGFSKLEFIAKTSGGFKTGEKHTKLTWALGGGLSAQVTNRFNIDAGYRYYHFGNFKKAKKVDATEIYGGVRYVF